MSTSALHKLASLNPGGQTGQDAGELGHRALLEGRPGDAIYLLNTAIAVKPQSHRLYYDRYAASLALNDQAMARESLTTALGLHALEVMSQNGVDLVRLRQDPRFAEQMAQGFYRADHPAVASTAFARALVALESTGELLASYGLSLQHQGRVSEAAEIFAIGSTEFQSEAIHSLLMEALSIGPDGARRYADEAAVWVQQYRALAPAVGPVPAPLNGRKLKVGYVVPNIGDTQLAQYLLPVLEAHDYARVEITLYTARQSDESGFAQFRLVDISGLTDDQAQRRIISDGIDVLIDTWGHNVGNRMGIFARRAAPIQVAWMHCVQTTGLPTMDYVLHAKPMKGPGTQALCTETICAMGDVTIPYRTTRRPATLAPPPSLTQGFMTFGCFNHPAKLSDESLANWSKILKALPTAKLLLKYRYYADPLVRAQMSARFLACGITADQLIFEGHETADAYMAAFERIDLMLDPSPCPDRTSSCDALAHNVPVLTLAGDDVYAQANAQVVAGVGLPEYIAKSWADYTQLAFDFANDPQHLMATRRKLFENFDTSALCDVAGFTRALEDQFYTLVDHAVTRPSALVG